MQQAAQRIDPMKMQDGTGILGRIRDSLQKKKGLSVGAFSLNTAAIVNAGKQGTTECESMLCFLFLLIFRLVSNPISSFTHSHTLPPSIFNSSYDYQW